MKFNKAFTDSFYFVSHSFNIRMFYSWVCILGAIFSYTILNLTQRNIKIRCHVYMLYEKKNVQIILQYLDAVESDCSKSV